jgi:hypothetical protein
MKNRTVFNVFVVLAVIFVSIMLLLNTISLFDSLAKEAIEYNSAYDYWLMF